MPASEYRKPAVAPAGNKSEARLLRRLFSHISSRRRRQLLLLLGLMLVGAVAELVSLGAVLPFLTLLADPEKVHQFPMLQNSLQAAGIKTGGQLVLPATILFVVLTLTAMAIRIVLNWATGRFAFGLGYDIGVEVYRRTLYQPYRYHVAHNTSEIIAGINTIQIVIQNVLLPLMQAFVSVIIASAILGALFAIDPTVAGVAGGAFTGVYLLVTITVRRRLRANSRVIAEAQGRRVQVVQEGLGGIRDVLIDSSQTVYLDRFKKVDGPMRTAQATNNLISTTPRYLIEAAGMVIIAGLAYYTMQRDGGLAEALPVLGALALGAQKLLPLLQAVYHGWSKVSGARAVLAQIMVLLEQPIPQEYLDKHSAGELAFGKDLELKDVAFRYAADGHPVLDGICLRIAKGMRVGFVGKTGSGKSTLLDLVMGLLESSGGSIEIDGVPIDASNRRAWHAHIAHVPQGIYLSDASIAENIAFGVEPRLIDMDKVRKAASEAQISDYVEALQNGYSTPVGERGVRLSGGQRQRIGIARALYKGADVLVLDEATSALDDATESAVMESVSRLGSHVTVLMIAHRLSTLKTCDMVVELDSGRVSRVASYQEIIAGRSDATVLNGAADAHH